MSTAKQRINISVSDEMRRVLIMLAKRDHVPAATKAAHLIATALEVDEDVVLNELAEKRDQERVRFTSHKKAWS